ncbi:MAG: NAD-dependent epimerase/dehydratase family protein [Rhodopseudomonas palustris]|uniref:NAD-dependent epimerase/dehydratase family protein n=1 Tax=Rhodopseudomonas palustris TaxID=1076 RepID=A0A933RYF9_RHOPL|nr:NAD-dependent epimerase/dehydratase family protein [Rhodopseudomonas palustris]
MTPEIVVLGYGPVGRATTAWLAAQGVPVRVAQRSRPAVLPRGAVFQSCDVLDRASVVAAVAGARQIVVAIGFPYVGEVWRQSWPLAMQNLLSAAAAANARMVFVDNLYMYGPQNEPLREDMPLTDVGVKPAVRAAITRLWMTASAAGQVRVAALRAPDFYGPGVGLSHLGDLAFGALARGKRAMLIAPPDTPHDFAYVPDIARAVATLLDAPDDAFGQAWHMPSAPIRTPRQILDLGARALGTSARISSLPQWLLPAIGTVSPMLREMTEMRFLWDRPYRVDAQKFKDRFWSDVTPFEIGAAATARSFRERAAALAA